MKALLLEVPKLQDPAHHCPFLQHLWSTDIAIAYQAHAGHSRTRKAEEEIANRNLSKSQTLPPKQQKIYRDNAKKLFLMIGRVRTAERL